MKCSQFLLLSANINFFRLRDSEMRILLEKIWDCKTNLLFMKRILQNINANLSIFSFHFYKPCMASAKFMTKWYLRTYVNFSKWMIKNWSLRFTNYKEDCYHITLFSTILAGELVTKLQPQWCNEMEIYKMRCGKGQKHYHSDAMSSHSENWLRFLGMKYEYVVSVGWREKKCEYGTLDTQGGMEGENNKCLDVYE